MRALLLLLLLVVAPAASAAEAAPAAPPPPAKLEGMPWYDAGQASWRRVEPQQERRRSVEDEGAAGAGISAFAYLMFAVVAVALLLLVAQLLRLRGVADDGGSAGSPAAPRADVAALPFALPAATDDPARALAAAIAARDWGLAIAWLYALQLLALDRAGVIRLLAGKTNRAYVREAARHPAAARALPATVDAFERSWFGHQPPTAEAFAALSATHRQLVAALPAEAA